MEAWARVFAKSCKLSARSQVQYIARMLSFGTAKLELLRVPQNMLVVESNVRGLFYIGSASKYIDAQFALEQFYPRKFAISLAERLNALFA